MKPIICFIIFKKPVWNKMSAVIWLYNNKHSYTSIDESNYPYIRFCQYMPIGLKCTNVDMGDGIEIVFGTEN